MNPIAFPLKLNQSGNPLLLTPGGQEVHFKQALEQVKTN